MTTQILYLRRALMSNLKYKLLLKNGKVDSNGQVTLPYALVKNILKLEINKVKYLVDKKAQTVAFKASFTNKEYVDYLNEKERRNRKFLYVKIRERATRPFVKIYFNRSKRLRVFLGRSFDLYYDRKNDLMRFHFFDFEQDRIFYDTIDNGVLTIQSYAPLDVKEFIERNKDYGIFKLASLYSRHGTEFEKTIPPSEVYYDLLISFDKTRVNELNKKLVNNRLVYEKTKTDYKRKLFIHKDAFPEFIKDKAVHYLVIPGAQKVWIKIDFDLYEDYLIREGFYTKDLIYNLKQNLSSGNSEYYEFYDDFIKSLITDSETERSGYKNYIKKKLQGINFSELDFSSKLKRTRYTSKVKIFFLENSDILLSKDMNLTIPLNLDYIKKELNTFMIEGFYKFKEELKQNPLKEKLYNPRQVQVLEIRSKLDELRFIGREIFDEELVKDAFYFYSILRSDTSLSFIKSKLRGSFDPQFWDKFAISASIFNAFRQYYPTHELVQGNAEYFLIDLAQIASIDYSEFKLALVFAYYIVYIFKATVAIKSLVYEFADKLKDSEIKKNILLIGTDLVRHELEKIPVSAEILAGVIFSKLVICLGLEEQISMYSVVRSPIVSKQINSHFNQTEFKNKIYKFNQFNTRSKENLKISLALEIIEYYTGFFARGDKKRKIPLSQFKTQLIGIIEKLFFLICKHQIVELNAQSPSVLKKNVQTLYSLMKKSTKLLLKGDLDKFYQIEGLIVRLEKN